MHARLVEESIAEETACFCAHTGPAGHAAYAGRLIPMATKLLALTMGLEQIRRQYHY